MLEVVSCLQVYMCSRLGTRRQVATKKGIVEAIHKLAIVAPFAYHLMPTNEAYV